MPWSKFVYEHCRALRNSSFWLFFPGLCSDTVCIASCEAFFLITAQTFLKSFVHCHYEVLGINEKKKKNLKQLFYHAATKKLNKGNFFLYTLHIIVETDKGLPYAFSLFHQFPLFCKGPITQVWCIVLNAENSWEAVWDERHKRNHEYQEPAECFTLPNPIERWCLNFR